MDHDLDDLRGFWDRQATTDPLWAILTYDGKSNRQWTLRDFMRSGEREIAQLFQRLEALHLDVGRLRALDFGCGVGRLTQALARRFSHVVGVDVSPAMVALARAVNRYPSVADYESNAGRDLATLAGGPVDFAYSNMVLQHVPPDLSSRAIADLVELLAPGGLLVFQLPATPIDPGAREIKPMANDAYRAAISLGTTDAPATMSAGREYTIPVRVGNASGEVWSQPLVGPLALGNHWLDATGDLMVVQDDGRAPLLQVMSPGEAVTLLLAVYAPPDPGEYVLELDIVHEGLTWFADRGSPVLRLRVDVQPSADAAFAPDRRNTLEELPAPEYDEARFAALVAGPAAEARPAAPMYGLAKDTVAAIVERHGARLAHVEDDACAGPEWISFRYFVRKDRSRG